MLKRAIAAVVTMLLLSCGPAYAAGSLTLGTQLTPQGVVPQISFSVGSGLTLGIEAGALMYPEAPRMGARAGMGLSWRWGNSAVSQKLGLACDGDVSLMDPPNHDEYWVGDASMDVVASADYDLGFARLGLSATRSLLGASATSLRESNGGTEAGVLVSRVSMASLSATLWFAVNRALSLGVGGSVMVVHTPAQAGAGTGQYADPGTYGPVYVIGRTNAVFTPMAAFRWAF